MIYFSLVHLTIGIQFSLVYFSQTMEWYIRHMKHIYIDKTVHHMEQQREIFIVHNIVIIIH